jgi:UPF0755 protein
MKEWRLRILLMVIIIAVGVPACVVTDLFIYMRTPAAREKDLIIPFIVSSQQRFDHIVDQLHTHHLIRYPFKMKLMGRIKKYDRKIIAGEYDLSPAMTPEAILDMLVAGKVRMVRLTVPEGMDLNQIADLVEQAGLGCRDAFYRAATDPDLTARLDVPADTMEGYLLPETYFFSTDVGPEQIIKFMAGQLQAAFLPQWRERAAALGLSIHEVVTLASIIEKETGHHQERGLVASVFHNRLNKKMRLQSDPTVTYGVADFSGRIRRKDLERDTPYNTYRIDGLPPGPIASPGLASIRAALFPDETDFLYFVSREDGSHHFSTNLRDHNNAVRRYQIMPRRGERGNTSASSAPEAASDPDR